VTAKFPTKKQSSVSSNNRGAFENDATLKRYGEDSKTDRKRQKFLLALRLAVSILTRPGSAATGVREFRDEVSKLRKGDYRGEILHLIPTNEYFCI